jgi:hypothetical protein
MRPVDAYSSLELFVAGFNSLPSWHDRRFNWSACLKREKFGSL